jgi:hypothetical protein
MPALAKSAVTVWVECGEVYLVQKTRYASRQAVKPAHPVCEQNGPSLSGPGDQMDRVAKTECSIGGRGVGGGRA